VSLETWHIKNEDSHPGGEEEGEWVGELGNMACHKQGLTCWRGESGRSGRNIAHHKRGLTNWKEEEGGAIVGVGVGHGRRGEQSDLCVAAGITCAKLSCEKTINKIIFT